MHITKWKKQGWQNYLLYDSNYTAFWKRANYGDSNRISGCQPLEEMEGAQRIFRTVKLLWYYSGRLYHCIIKLSEPIECTTASSVQSLSRVQLFVTLRTAAHQASLSITNSWSPHKPTSIESMTPSSHLILCCLLLLLPPTPPSIRVFSNESALGIRWPKYWSFSFSISPSNEHPGLISFRMDRLDLLAVQGTLKSLLYSSALSFLHSPTLTSMHDHWKNHSLD